MKKNFIILMIIMSFSSYFSYSQTTGFFHYKKLNNGIKKSIEHYVQNYKKLGFIIIIMMEDFKDSLSFSLVGCTGIWTYVESPSYYYSIHDGKIILIYNGSENDYYPSESDVSLMVDFLSNFLDPSMDVPVGIDWSKKPPELDVKRANPQDEQYQRGVIYDPAVVEYKVNSDSIICVKKSNSAPGYPMSRFRYKIKFDPPSFEYKDNTPRPIFEQGKFH